MRVQSCLALSAALLAGGPAFATVYDVSPAGTEGYTAKNLILMAKNAATQKGDIGAFECQWKPGSLLMFR